MSRYAVMKHLGVLNEASLVLYRKQGRERWNYLNAVPLREMYERWVSTLDDQWAASLTGIGRLAGAQQALQEGEPMKAISEINMFQVRQEHRIMADRETVFQILTQRIGEWWRHPYRLHEGDARIELDPRPGGTLAERWEPDGFAVWGTVLTYESGTTLELIGPCGMAGAISGRFGFTLEDGEGQTILRVEHDALGIFDDDQQGNYEYGWSDMLGQLKALAEQE